MLQLDLTLPPGALIGDEGRLLDKALARTSGARFVARDADVLRAGGTISGWREANAAAEAVTTKPNAGNSRFDPGPPGSFRFETGVYCGFVLTEFAPEVDRFTVAIIYGSAGEARTLCSVSAGQANNMVFLSESGGKLLAKDRQSTTEIALDLPHDLRRPRLAMMCYTGRTLILRLAGRVIKADGAIPGLGHPADFFIGCRSNRPGLAKTLGASRMHEVMFWPDRAILGSADPDDAAALAAVDRYHRWTY